VARVWLRGTVCLNLSVFVSLPVFKRTLTTVDVSKLALKSDTWWQQFTVGNFTNFINT